MFILQIVCTDMIISIFNKQVLFPNITSLLNGAEFDTEIPCTIFFDSLRRKEQTFN